MARGLVDVKLDQRSYDRAMARLAKYEGAPLKKRMEAAFRSGLGLVSAPMRSVAPRASGKLRGTVSVRKGRPSSGYFVRYGTKPRAPHSHLVSQGHRIVTPGGRDTGRRSRANPFISNVISSHEGRITKFISEALADDGIRAYGSFGGF